MYLLGTTVSYCSPTFTVNENDGRACIELCLDVPATFPFTANVDCSNNNLTSKCCIAFMFGIHYRNHFY